jgi:DNA modification methylase
MKKTKKKFKKYTQESSERKVIKENLLLASYKQSMKSNLQNVVVYIGDVKRTLTTLPEGIVDCVVTSPPYWRQRDYRHSEQIGQEITYQEYIKKLVEVFSEMKRILKPTGTFFLNIGYKYRSKELLLIPELLANELQRNGWTLLNKIIWYKPNAMPSSLESRFSNVYEPVFLFVRKESKYKYYLSLDELRLPANNFNHRRKPEEILGYEVENSLLRNRKLKGYISKIFRNNNGEIIAKVDWENSQKTFEVVRAFDKESQISIKLICDHCGKTISHEIDLSTHVSCEGHLLPILPPKIDFNIKKELKPYSLLFPLPSRTYNGKYKLSPENRGASPGARKSLFGEYLVLQRRYKIYQPVVADYLRFWRKKRRITTKEIDRLLGYRDTAAHWFRKDMGSWGKGGSIPLPEDWFRLKKILKFDDIYDRWITETHLVLQTVKAHPKGKNPGDVWEVKLQPNPIAHFATFPEELDRRYIKAGCPQNGVVLDPFAGSGTTGKVAQDLGRNAILIELIPDYLNIIQKKCKKIEEVIYVK